MAKREVTISAFNELRRLYDIAESMKFSIDDDGEAKYNEAKRVFDLYKKQYVWKDADLSLWKETGLSGVGEVLLGLTKPKDNTGFDKQGCCYSEDGLWLLKVKEDVKKCIIKDGTVYIAKEAMKDCKSLCTVILPESVCYIGAAAFYNCMKLNSLTLTKNITVIGANPFFRSGIQELIVETPSFSYHNDYLTTADYEVLIACFNHDELLPDMGRVASIGNSAFEDCMIEGRLPESHPFVKLDIPSSCKRIGKNAFAKCWHFSELVVPEGVEFIEDMAFNYCMYQGIKEENKGLQRVTLPKSLKCLGKKAFSECKSLSHVVFLGDTFIEKNAFDHCEALHEIVVPQKSFKRVQDSMPPARKSTIVCSGYEDEYREKEYDIFISYRRNGGDDTARIMNAELTKRGFSVFIDFDELKDGTFESRILTAIKRSKIFLLILSEGSLERCCKDSEDWVRREILYAAKHGLKIVPLHYYDQKFFGFPSSLPQDLKDVICNTQISDIAKGMLFDVSINKMVVERILPKLKEDFSADDKLSDATLPEELISLASNIAKQFGYKESMICSLFEQMQSSGYVISKNY